MNSAFWKGKHIVLFEIGKSWRTVVSYRCSSNSVMEMAACAVRDGFGQNYFNDRENLGDRNGVD